MIIYCNRKNFIMTVSQQKINEKSISTIKLLITVALIFLVSAQDKADHFKGQNNFDPGSCTQPTCIMTSSNSWRAYLGHSPDFIARPFQLHTNLNLIGTVSPDYWAYLTDPDPDGTMDNNYLCIYRKVSIIREKQFQLTADYFIPSSQYVSTEQMHLYMIGANSNSILQNARTSTIIWKYLTGLTENTRTTVSTDPATLPIHQHMFLYICDQSNNRRGPRVTNIRLFQICLNTQMVITLTDGTERCGDFLTLSQNINTDFFRYVSGSTTLFQFDSCNSTGLTPITVSLGVVQGCAQKNSFNASTYKKTSVRIHNSNKFYLIPQSCNLQDREIICNQSFVTFCRTYDFSGSCLSCEKDYAFSIDRKKCIKRVNYCSVYSLVSGECSTCISEYTLSAGVCLRCQFGFYALQGVCVQDSVSPFPCTQTQYRNSQGLCVEGNVANCYSYSSPLGECETCKSGYEINAFKECVSQCPTASISKKYLRVNGRCVLVDIQCVLANQDGYCAVCEEDYYANKGTCYLISSVTSSFETQLEEPQNPFLKDEYGNEYIPMPKGARIYISGPWKNKKVYIDEDGDIYQRTYLTGMGHGFEVFADFDGDEYILKNVQKIYIKGYKAA